jgi:hypothetical protein
MDIGLLWLETNPKKTLAEIITEAARCYHAKYNVWPSLVFANPKNLDGQHYDPAHVKPAKYILPNHYWIGQSDSKG